MLFSWCCLALLCSVQLQTICLRQFEESRTSQLVYAHICVMVIVMEPRGSVQLSSAVNRLLLLELKGGGGEGGGGGGNGGTM